jgi:hypothetical protein
MRTKATVVLCIAFILWGSQLFAQPNKNSPIRFHALVLAENGGHHIAFTKTARPWLDKLAADSSFAIDYIENPNNIDDSFLSKYQLFIQLDYPPYGWPEKAVKAFESYIEQGKGGWIGLHHATLLGEFDGFPMWNWFYDFMGKIRFKNYIPTFASGKVNIEDKEHPVMKNISSPFFIEKEEWYTYDTTPRPNVHVIASVDESSYSPNSEIKMGDHPVVWTNTKMKARNIYIFMGHSPDLLNNSSYTTLLRNAIFWAVGK